MIRYIDQYKNEIVNKKVILRIDYNVPLQDGKVKDDTRIIESLETINFLLNLNCDIILLTHLGRPKTEEDKKKYTTKILYSYINENKIFNTDVEFLDNFNELVFKGGKIYLFENVRFFEGETKNSLDLAKNFAKLADVFVNDAFGSLHRVHSSVAGISNFLPTFFGFLVKKEIENLTKFTDPKGKFTLILGGAKISDKLGLIKNIKAHKIFIGGAMALTIYKQMGKNIGKSFYEDIDINDLINNPKIILPNKFVTVDDNYQNKEIKEIDQVGNEIIVDVIFDDDQLQDIENSELVFWNGPMGIFEKGFQDGSMLILASLKKAKEKSRAFVSVGGGDTLSFINKNLSKQEIGNYIDFVSTGGGATLEFLEKSTLSAIEYIINNVKV